MEAQLKIRQDAHEAQEYMRDLLKWQDDQRRKDQSLNASSNGTEKQIPAVRAASATANQATQKTTLASSANVKHPAAHVYDNYANKWDNFNDDAAIASDGDDRTSTGKEKQPLSTESQHPLLHATSSKQTSSAKLLGNIKQQSSSASPSNEQRNKESAEAMRNVGNEYFKKGQYKNAKESYTKSITEFPSCLGYANRAMASLKLGDYQQAERDCSQAINLDPLYVKAFHRRASARKILKNFTGAVQDLESALRLEPTNKTLQQDFDDCIRLAGQQFASTFNAPRARIPVTIKRDFEPAAASRPKPATAAVTGQNHGTMNSSEPSEGAASMADSKQHEGEGAITALKLPETVGKPGPSTLVGTSIETSGQAAKDPTGLQRQSVTVLSSTTSPPAVLTSAQPSAGTNNTPERADTVHLLQKEAATTTSTGVQPGQLHGQRSTVVIPLGVGGATRTLRPPNSGAEFETTWRSFKDDAALQGQYLQLLTPPTLPQLFKLSVTAPLLVSLVRVAVQQVLPQAPAFALDLLSHVRRIPRFSMVCMLITKSDRATLKSQVEAAMQAMDGNDATRLLELVSAYT